MTWPMRVVSNTSPILSLAIETKADVILLDERDARKVAQRLKLRTTGVVGVLLKAYRMKRISDLSAALQQLKTRAGFRLSDQVTASVLSASGSTTHASQTESP